MPPLPSKPPPSDDEQVLHLQEDQQFHADCELSRDRSNAPELLNHNQFDQNYMLSSDSSQITNPIELTESNLERDFERLMSNRKLTAGGSRKPIDLEGLTVQSRVSDCK